MIEKFRLPRFHEIPNVGLFLEQVAKYLNEYLFPIDNNPVTGSMISNYVKMGLLRSPHKKQYDREQIATLIFICTVKGTLSLENVHLLLEIQRERSQPEHAYNFFCDELENFVTHIGDGGGTFLVAESDDDSSMHKLLRNTLLTVANKAYLVEVFQMLKKERNQN